MPSLTGTTLGRYRLEASHGVGGMAEVYRATDTRLGRTVAVKVVLPAYAGEPQFRERFVREARLVAALEHPNVLPVYDFGEHDDLPFLVMPFVERGSLAERLEAGAQPAASVARWIAELAGALDAAHAAGILHRDVKPSNVLLDKGERALLADFGIAQAAGAATRLTATGSVVGTPAYMAPELAQGEPSSPASDRYALGVLAYELLAGKPPFEGENALSVLHQHVSRPVPPLAARAAGLPAAVDRFFEVALAKRPAARPPTCQALADELLAALRPALGGTDTLPTLGMELPAAGTGARLASGSAAPGSSGAGMSSPAPAGAWTGASTAVRSSVSPTAGSPTAPTALAAAPSGGRAPSSAMTVLTPRLPAGARVRWLLGAGATVVVAALALVLLLRQGPAGSRTSAFDAASAGPAFEAAAPPSEPGGVAPARQGVSPAPRPEATTASSPPGAERAPEPPPAAAGAPLETPATAPADGPPSDLLAGSYEDADEPVAAGEPPAGETSALAPRPPFPRRHPAAGGTRPLPEGRARRLASPRDPQAGAGLPPRGDRALRLAETLLTPGPAGPERFRQLEERAGVALARRPDDPFALALQGYARGGLAYVRGDDHAAREALTGLAALDRLPPWLLAVGPLWVLRDRPEAQPLADWELAVAFADARSQGLAAADRHLAGHPDDPRGLFGRAFLHHLHGERQPAIDDALRVHAWATAHDPGKVAAVAMFLGEEYAALGRYAEALEWLRQAVAAGGKEAGAAALYAGRLAEEKLGDRSAAAELYRLGCEAGNSLACQRAEALGASR